MPSSKKLLKSFRGRLLKKASLYLVLDAQVCSYARLFEIAKKAVSAGVDVIQLRDKFGSAKDILEFSIRMVRLCCGKTLYIVNDRIDLALLSGADGVHLGQDDISCTEAREMLGRNRIIGVSCQNGKHLKAAQNDGADYIGFGSVFKTQTKPLRQPVNLKLLKEIYQQARLPVFAIGGIKLENAEGLLKIGVNRIAVTRALSLTSNIEKSVFHFKKIFPHV